MKAERESADEKGSGLFPETQPEPAADAASPPGAGQGRWKVAVVAAAVAAVAIVVALAAGADAPSAEEPATRGELAAAGTAETDEGLPAEATVLAGVNGIDITSGDLAMALRALQPEEQAVFEHDKLELLDGLIIRQLLGQEARRLSRQPAAAGEGAEAQGSGGDVQTAIERLLQEEVFAHVQVADQDVRAFYEAHKEELRAGDSFEDIGDQLRPYVEAVRRREAFEDYVTGLRERASITLNDAWVAEQKERAADNPLDRALQTGRPVLADFGRDSCLPCQEMKPILEKLAEEYRGRADIIIVDTTRYPMLARRCEIQGVPTQIFYDSSGQELGRHRGFMSRDDLVAQLAEMGVE